MAEPTTPPPQDISTETKSIFTPILNAMSPMTAQSNSWITAFARSGSSPRKWTRSAMESTPPRITDPTDSAAEIALLLRVVRVIRTAAANGAKRMTYAKVMTVLSSMSAYPCMRSMSSTLTD